METIELKLSLSKEQFDMICTGLKALADSMSAIMADNMADKVADKQPSSNTYIDTNTSKETNTPTNTNTSYDYKTRVDSLISSLASNTKFTTDTTKSTLNTTLTTTNKNNNNIIINNMSGKEIDNMSGEEIVNTNIENSNTCKEERDIPTLNDVIGYVAYRGYKMNSQKFYDYYSKNHWKTMGGVSIAGKWRGFVDRWAQNEYNAKGQPQETTAYTGGKAGMGTVEDRHATHPFVPSF